MARRGFILLVIIPFLIIAAELIFSAKKDCYYFNKVNITLYCVCVNMHIINIA